MELRFHGKDFFTTWVRTRDRVLLLKMLIDIPLGWAIYCAFSYWTREVQRIVLPREVNGKTLPF